MSLPNHQQAASEEVQKLMKRGAITAALGFVIPFIPNVFSIAFFVRAYDRSTEEFWKRKSLFAVGLVCNLSIVAAVGAGGYIGYRKFNEKMSGLVSRVCFNPRQLHRTRVDACTNAIVFTRDKKELARIHFTLGILHLQAQELEDAVTFLQLASAEDSEYAFKPYALALAKALRQHAPTPLDELVKAHPENLNAHLYRCLYYATEEKLVDAMSDCTAAVQLSQNDPRAHEARGYAELQSHNAKDAIHDYDVALGIDAKRTPALYGRGQAKIELGEKDDGKMDVLNAKVNSLDIEANFSALSSLE